MNFLLLIRFPNLLIIALTQYLLQYFYLNKILANYTTQPTLSHTAFLLLTITTILIAAGGYIINDIEDIAIDSMNKDISKQIVGRIYPLSIARQFYYTITLFSLITASILAFYINNFYLILFFLGCILGLWAYSKWLKKMVLIGNIVVALFCALVALLVFYLQEKPIGKQEVFFEIKTLFTHYAILAFISTLFREIIKDIEDVEGDRANNCKTLPIVWGIKSAKKIAFFIGICLLFFSIYLNLFLKQNVLKILFLNISITIPILYALYFLIKSKEKKDFSYLSLLAKYIMLSGLFFILILSF